MTVGTEVTKVFAPGNGSARSFSGDPLTTFKDTELLVVRTDAGGKDTTLVIGIGADDYDVVLTTPDSLPSKFTITYPADEKAAALSTGETLTIKQDLPSTQETDLENQGGYFPDTQEQIADRAIILINQLKEQLDRSVKAALTEQNLTGFDLPNTDQVTGGQGLALSADKTQIEFASISGTLPDPVTVARGGTGATTALAAFTALATDALASRQVLNLDKSGADVASAATIDLDAATGDFVDVTGTATITGITLSDGVEKTVRFTEALTLTNRASLVLPGSVNITTAAGDFAVFRGDSGSVVRLIAYQRAARRAYDALRDVFTTRGDLLVEGASGEARLAIGAANTFLISNGINPAYVAPATQAEQETGTALNKPVTPARQHFHKSAAKAWAQVAGDGSANQLSYNVSSTTDTGIGDLEVSWDSVFSTAIYPVVAALHTGVANSAAKTVVVVAKAAGSVSLFAEEDGIATDPGTSYSVIAFGDR